MSKTSDFNIIELEFAKIPFLQKYEGPGGEVAIPEGVVLISSLAFSSNKNIISIEIPSTVTEIKDWTFYLQHALKKVSIPDSVEIFVLQCLRSTRLFNSNPFTYFSMEFPCGKSFWRLWIHSLPVHFNTFLFVLI